MDESKLKDQNILLVKEGESDELKAVAGIGKDGKLEIVEAKGENSSQFLKFDRNNRVELETVMADFNRRPDNPKDFQLFQVHYGKFEKLKESLEEVLSRPHNSEGKELLKTYEVDPKDFAVKKAVEAPKVILTRGEDGRLKAVANGRDGKLKTVDPTKENADGFLKIDMNGNALENFFKKFAEQFDNPSHTGIYAVSADAVDKMSAFLDKIITLNPDDKVLDPYRVTPDGREQNPEQQKFQPLDLNKLDWKEVEKLGISHESLRDALKAMAWGHKSPGLIEIKPVIGGQEYPMQARLSLHQQPNGSISIQTHPWQAQPDFEKPFMGIVFTEADKEQLQKTGHGGRIFDLELSPGGEKVPSLVSLDKMTNRVEAVPLSQINIPQTLKNAPLSPEQQQGLREGKPVLVENMDKKVKSGEEPQKITRIVQYNAVNKNFDFMFTAEQKEQHRQERATHREQSPQGERQRKGQYVGEVWVPKVMLGVPLTDGQFKSIVEGKATWVEGMTPPQPKQQGEKQVVATDAKGEKFNAWVKPNQVEGKLKFYKWNPDRSKKVTPANESKTQVAVNSHGKTNEATKHVKEPLKQGQQKPTEQQQRRFYKKPAGKSTGHKM